MSKTLSFQKEQIRVLVSSELASVQGGVGGEPVSSALKPTATAVSSVEPGKIQPTSSAIHHGPVSSAKPPVHHKAKPTSSAIHHGPVSSAKPTATAVSSAWDWD